jgi:hypothetical protein
VKLVYCAGPYRAKTAWGVDQNISRARQWGALVACAGAYPVIPHSNTAHFDGIAEDKFWLDSTLELMRRCDAVLMMDGWKESTGSCAEKTLAESLNMPVLDLDWLSIREKDRLTLLQNWISALPSKNLFYDRFVEKKEI